MVWPSAEGLRVDLSNRPHTMTTTPSSKGASAHKLEHYSETARGNHRAGVASRKLAARDHSGFMPY